jgi:hypothetical protein
MENNVKKALSNFVDEPEEEQEDTQAKEVVLHEREGLIERVDKKFVTNDGRQLLREHY